MVRWSLLFLFLALSGIGAAVVGRRINEQARPLPVPWDEDQATPVAETTTWRILAKQRIAREVTAGTRPLAEAAALFRELNRVPPALVAPLVDPNSPGHTEEERLCRQVISYVASPGRECSPTAAAAAVTRLESELREELRRHGAVRLPEPAGLPSAAELLMQARLGMTEAERRLSYSDSRATPPGR